MEGLSPEVLRRLTTAVERMPAFPRSVQKILELTRDINCLPKDLVGVVEKDPVMTMKILRIINSAYYNLPYKITSVNQSVVYLGLNTIKNLALSFAAAGMLPRMNAAGFDMQRYLVHSLTTAAFARELCNVFARAEADAGDCYIAGLLHDFGKVVLAQYMAGDFRQALAYAAERAVPLHQAERAVIGADHGLVGAMLAAKWAFPAHLVDCIRDHHNPPAPAGAMMDCLRVADQISRIRSQSAPDAVDWSVEATVAPERFGAELGAVVAALGDADKVVADALMFAEAEGGR